MAGMPTIRCYNCKKDIGIFRDTIIKLREYIKHNPSKQSLLVQAYDQFDMCTTCRIPYITEFSEFDNHILKPNTMVPQSHTTDVYNSDKSSVSNIVDKCIYKR